MSINSTVSTSNDNNNDNIKLQIVETDDKIKICQDIRYQIFIIEQNIPKDVEVDGKDYNVDTTIHVIGYYKNQPVATGRVVIDIINKTNDDNNNNNNNIHYEANIGRIAIIQQYRNRGWGSQIVQKLESIIINKLNDENSNSNSICCCRIYLTPHYYLQKFYEKFGYYRVSTNNNNDNNNNDDYIIINEYCKLITMEKYIRK